MSALSLLELEGVSACCDDESWKPVPGWPHEASTCGQVRSVTRIDAEGCLRLGQMLPQLPNAKGYLYVVLLDGKRRRRVHVAVAVLEAHRGLKPTPGHEAGHAHGIRTDNHLAGLAWVTKVQNRADRERHRKDRLVTASVTDNGPKCGQDRRVLSQGGRFPRRARPPVCHAPSVTRQGLSTTGRSRTPFNFPSVPLFLNPLSILRSLRPRRIPR